MTNYIKNILKNIDWILFSAVILVVCAGLVTMNSFDSQASLFSHQVVWLILSVGVFIIASSMNWSFLKDTRIVVSLFAISVFLLSLLFVVGRIRGAQSWFNLGAFSFQPVDFVKLVVILILAKYFSRRHIEIANIRHILTSGFYVFVVFILVLFQPAFGSAMIIFLLWLGMMLLSGISKKHLLAVFVIGAVVFAVMWGFILKPFQRDRIQTFIHPLTNLTGTGYHAYQSMIAVGSGELFGKGIGYGSQSKLQFLPEYETDFIFASFAEEWGFIGVLLLFLLYSIIFWRMLAISSRGATNFEILFGLGLTVLFFIQTGIHVGMNIGLLPITGNTLPFMSYGGSHLMFEFFGLGILMGMKRYGRTVHKSVAQNEMVGV